MKLTAIILTFFLLSATEAFAANENAQLKQQVAQLQEQVNQLQKQLNSQQPTRNQAQARPAYSYHYWDPFQEMEMMRERMMGLMQDSFASPMFEAKSDIKQTDNAYIVTFDLPGMEKDKINVEVKEGALIVSGERSSETKEDKGNQYFRQERSFGHFMQAIPLPEDAKQDNINAQYNNGVLTVTIGREKRTEKQPESKKITVK